MNLDANHASSSADDSGSRAHRIKAGVVNFGVRRVLGWLALTTYQLVTIYRLLATYYNGSLAIIFVLTIITTMVATGVISTVVMKDPSFGFVTLPIGICILGAVTVMFSQIAVVIGGFQIGIAPFAAIVVTTAICTHLVVASAARNSLRRTSLIGLEENTIIGFDHPPMADEIDDEVARIKAELNELGRRPRTVEYWPSGFLVVVGIGLFLTSGNLWWGTLVAAGWLLSASIKHNIENETRQLAYELSRLDTVGPIEVQKVKDWCKEVEFVDLYFAQIVSQGRQLVQSEFEVLRYEQEKHQSKRDGSWVYSAGE